MSDNKNRIGGDTRTWWQDRDTAATNLFGAVETISQVQADMVVNFMRYAALYGNWETLSWASTVFGRAMPELRLNRISFNIVQNMIDTVVAKHAMTAPRVEVITENGNWEQQQRGKNSTKLLAGEFDRIKLYRLAPLMLRDSLIFGDGYLKFFVANGKPDVERVFPGEMVVDNAEAINGTPRSMYQVRYIDRSVLMATWPEHEVAIALAQNHDTDLGLAPSTANLIKVIEGWHLPSAPGAKDGKHIIAINGQVLDYCDWEYDCFPFVRLNWSSPLQGWYSQGLAEQMMGIQLELNKLLRTVQLSMHLMSIPYYLVEQGSRVTKSHLNNQVGHIVEYAGVKPEARVNQSVHPEVFAQIDRLFNRAYELAGISPMDAQAKKPVGLESRPALAEYADLASERHAHFSMKWKEVFSDCAWQIFRCVREIGPSYRSRGADKKYMVTIKGADCELEDDNYTFRLADGNLLPTTPAGKKNFVQDLAQAGILTPEQALQLLQYPDIEAVTGKMTATDDYTAWLLNKMLTDGDYVAPEPFLAPKLPKILQTVNDAYLEAQMNGVEEDRLELLRMFIRDAADILMPPEPPMDPLAMAAPGAPAPTALDPMLPPAEPIPGSPMAPGMAPPAPPIVA